MRAFGAPGAEIERMEQALQARKSEKAAESSPDLFGVWADNLPVIEAWSGVETQWRTAGITGVKTGLDYSAVIDWLELFVGRVGDRKNIMQGIQVMERAALAAMAELREQEKRE